MTNLHTLKKASKNDVPIRTDGRFGKIMQAMIEWDDDPPGEGLSLLMEVEKQALSTCHAQVQLRRVLFVVPAALVCLAKDIH